MTTVDTPHAPATTATWPVFAAAAAGTAVVLTAIGTFWSPLSDYEVSGGWDATYLIVIGVIAVLAAAVFGLVVRTATPANADRRGLVLGVLGLVSIVGFWTGAPAVLAGGAAACVARRGRWTTAGRATVALVATTLALAVWLALAG